MFHPTSRVLTFRRGFQRASVIFKANQRSACWAVFHKLPLKLVLNKRFFVLVWYWIAILCLENISRAHWSMQSSVTAVACDVKDPQAEQKCLPRSFFHFILKTICTAHMSAQCLPCAIHLYYFYCSIDIYFVARWSDRLLKKKSLELNKFFFLQEQEKSDFSFFEPKSLLRSWI